MPGISHATSATVAALTTSRNRPSVSIVIGSVSTTSSGRMNALTSPSTSPATISVPALSNRTPEITKVAAQKPIAANRPRSRMAVKVQLPARTS